MSVVGDERTKLFAAALNNVAVATLITGVIAPAANFLYGLTSSPGGHFWPVVAGCWFFCGVILHLAAVGSGKADTMSGLELYLIIAPLVLAALGMGVAWWYFRH